MLCSTLSSSIEPLTTSKMYHCPNPDGDVLITLRHTNADFAPWVDEEEFYLNYSECLDEPGLTSNQVNYADSSSGRSKGRKTKKKKRSSSMRDLETDISSPSEQLGHLPSLEESTPGVNDMAPTYEEVLTQVEAVVDASASDPTTKSATTKTDNITHFRTSSQHLKMASPHFKRVLSETWQEGHLLHKNGETVIELEEWDSKALSILLNIIHGRTRSVPRSIDLELLAKIAVLVDYYQCLEATELFVEKWMAEMKSKPPTNYARDLILWIQICCVFKHPNELSTAVRTVVEESRGPVQTLGLPIPGNLISMFSA